jgi:hypothetical protein
MDMMSNNPVDTAHKGGMKTSCENHEKCMKMIQSILDGEATEEEKDHFRDNMDVCMPCINEFHLVKCIKESLCNRVERKTCPDNLINTIKLKLDLL